MVAIVDPQREVDLEKLAKGYDKALPAYARPLFLRILTEIKLTGKIAYTSKCIWRRKDATNVWFCTGTYKVVKTDLQAESFNVNKVKDPIYFKDPAKGFVPVTESLYNDIINGVVKV